jgi:hypothetical protein
MATGVVTLDGKLLLNLSFLVELVYVFISNSIDRQVAWIGTAIAIVSAPNYGADGFEPQQ